MPVKTAVNIYNSFSFNPLQPEAGITVPDFSATMAVQPGNFFTSEGAGFSVTDQRLSHKSRGEPPYWYFRYLTAATGAFNGHGAAASEHEIRDFVPLREKGGPVVLVDGEGRRRMTTNWGWHDIAFSQHCDRDCQDRKLQILSVYAKLEELPCEIKMRTQDDGLLAGAELLWLLASYLFQGIYNSDIKDDYLLVSGPMGLMASGHFGEEDRLKKEIMSQVRKEKLRGDNSPVSATSSSWQRTNFFRATNEAGHLNIHTRQTLRLNSYSGYCDDPFYLLQLFFDLDRHRIGLSQCRYSDGANGFAPVLKHLVAKKWQACGL